MPPKSTRRPMRKNGMGINAMGRIVDVVVPPSNANPVRRLTLPRPVRSTGAIDAQFGGSYRRDFSGSLSVGSSSSRSVAAPVSVGTQRTVANRAAKTIIHFSYPAAALYCATTANTMAFGQLTTPPPNAAANVLDITPFSSYNPNFPGVGILGPAILSVAKCFSRYRFSALRFRYVSALPSSTAGSMHLAWCNDASCGGASSVNNSNIFSMQPRIESPVWASTGLNLSKADLNRLPWYSMNPVGSGAPNLRLAAPGCLAFTTLGMTATGTTVFLGELIIEGTLELHDLTNPANNGNSIPIVSDGSLVPGKPSVVVYSFGLDGTPCTAAAPFGSGVPQLITGDLLTPFVFTSTTLKNLFPSQATAYNIHIEWCGAGVTGNPGVSALGPSAVVAHAAADGSTTVSLLAATLTGLTSTSDGATITGPTTLVKGVCTVTIRSIV